MLGGSLLLGAPFRVAPIQQTSAEEGADAGGEARSQEKRAQVERGLAAFARKGKVHDARRR